MLTKEEKEILVELICDKQNRMIIKDHRKYESKKYKNLEKLKVKIKDFWGDYYSRYYYVLKWKLWNERKML